MLDSDWDLERNPMLTKTYSIIVIRRSTVFGSSPCRVITFLVVIFWVSHRDCYCATFVFFRLQIWALFAACLLWCVGVVHVGMQTFDDFSYSQIWTFCILRCTASLWVRASTVHTKNRRRILQPAQIEQYTTGQPPEPSRFEPTARGISPLNELALLLDSFGCI